MLASGSSLGGARPKASVLDLDGHLAISKFPHHSDEYNVVLCEALALKLAELCGIKVPEGKVEKVFGKSVLISRRFDRKKEFRIPYLSAMSMLNAKDNESHSYLEIADVVKQFGSNPKEDLKELWKRIVFNIMISNSDDHLRNHGFLYKENTGWDLAPAFDLNPVSRAIKPPILSTSIIDGDNTASLELACNVINYFALTNDEANQIVDHIKNMVSSWKKIAKKIGLTAHDIDYIESAFFK